MKIVRLLVYAITNLLVLNVNVSPLFAEAPATPKILFTSVRDRNYEVYVMNVDGSHQVNLTRNPADDFQAIWSPTGEQILFVSDRNDGIYDLYLMNPDGSNIRRVFKRKRNINRSHPTWSPDGKQIAYSVTDWNCSKSTIYIATLGEQDEQEFVIDGTDPAWSPDGTGIACSIEERLTFVNLRTRARKQFLPKKGIQWQRRPSWATGGDKLVFSGTTMQSSWIGRGAMNGWTKIQSLLSTGTARVSISLLMKRVRMRGLPSCRRMDKKSFIHRRLMGHTRFSKLMCATAFGRS